MPGQGSTPTEPRIGPPLSLHRDESGWRRAASVASRLRTTGFVRWALRERWYIALLVLAFALRLFQFGDPPDGAHEFRQTQTLMLAQSYAQGADLLAPQVSFDGPV